MKNNLGFNTPNGFQPAVPAISDFMSMITNGNQEQHGWDEINGGPAGERLKPKQTSPEEDLYRCYVQTFASPAGQKVLEDILNMTLRRSSYLNNDSGGLSLEQQTAYGLERKGQNGLAVAILAKIVSGQNLPAPAAKKKTKP